MKQIFLSFYALIFISAIVFGQKPFCADSSIRMQYIFSTKGAELINVVDTSGINYFAGAYGGALNIQPDRIAIMKTNWGDSIFWAKRFFTNSATTFLNNILPAPNSTLIGGGIWSVSATSGRILICSLDTNGNLLWAKRFGPVSGNPSQATINKSLLVANNAIYFFAGFNGGNYNILVKLDLNGNILWSRSFSMNSSNATQFLGRPIYYNNALYFLGGPGITKLNDADGTVIESNIFTAAPDPLISSLSIMAFNHNANGNFSLTGHTINTFGATPCNILMDAGFNQISATAYKNNFFWGISPLDLQFDFNTQSQHALLGEESFASNNKYFVTFGSKDEILHSRKLVVPGIYSPLYISSVNFDDKQNLHYIFHSPVTLQGSPIITEYARISNFSPNGTLGCFGKDTSIFKPYPFKVIKQPFIWDNIGSNVITGNDVTFLEDTAVVTKQVVCKIVSYCDSIHIKGPSSVCVNQPARFSIFKNNSCYKNLDWLIDTAAANIISTEGDSAITISFKKAFSGYIHAAITDCVVKDSFFVQAVTPVYRSVINHTDSVLCPGKTLLLTAQSGFTNYLWQGGIAATQLTVNNVGLYRITATDSCGNTRADSISVLAADTSLTLLPLTQTICLYDTAFIQLPANVNNITWQPNTNSLLRNNTLVAYPTQNTVYSISAEHLQNCTVTKTAAVTIKICPETAFIPNAFSPDKNGLNDLFKPIFSQPLAAYHLLIYNRYGQPVFETADQYSGWDGTYKGSRQPIGGYMYLCNYRFAAKTEKTVSGYFMLVR
jgi:gliding motility-associated-like protein